MPGSSRARNHRTPRTVAIAAAAAVAAAGLFVPAIASAAEGTTYYIDPSSGSDSSSGTSTSTAWRTVDRATSATFAPGDSVLIRRGTTTSGTLTVAESGTSTTPITVGAYGTGAVPVITGGCLRLTGSHLSASDVQLDNCTWAGVQISGSNNTLRTSVVTHNVTGVHIKSTAKGSKVLNNVIKDNNRMSVNTVGGDDDSGAFGILIAGDSSDIAHNVISGSDAASYDYGRDGAAVEIYGGIGNRIHHNTAIDNDAFAELGNSRSADNVFAYNVVKTALDGATFLVTRGDESSWGPVLGTVLENNTVQMSGASSQGFICHGGCNASVLKMRNNIITATWKVGYADAPFDEDFNLYHGGQVQFQLGSHSLVADPGFVSASTGDLHLSSTSTAVDRGAPQAWTSDRDGAAVPQDGDADGTSAVDIGAYELGGAVTESPTPTVSPSDGVEVGATGFGDGFETGDLSRWSESRVGGDGTVAAQQSIVRSGAYAVRLSATRNSGSFAVLRKQLAAPATSLTVQGDFRISTEGSKGGNVPLLRLFDSSGSRLVTVARQNHASDKVYVEHNGSYRQTTGRVPLNRWVSARVAVTTAGSTSLVELSLDGKVVYRTTSANLGTTGVLTVQLGNDTKSQQFTLAADNVTF